MPFNFCVIEGKLPSPVDMNDVIVHTELVPPPIPPHADYSNDALMTEVLKENNKPLLPPKLPPKL